MAEHPAPLGHHLERSLKRLVTRVGKVFLVLALLVTLSLLMVLPTWYLAQNHPRLYTVAALILIAVAILVRATLSLRASLKRYGRAYFLSQVFLPTLGRLVPRFLLGLSGLAAVFFLMAENYAPASLAAFLFFLGVGLRIL